MFYVISGLLLVCNKLYFFQRDDVQEQGTGLYDDTQSGCSRLYVELAGDVNNELGASPATGCSQVVSLHC